MSASTLGEKASVRQNFRDWRRSRPFWGGVTAIIAGIEMYGLTAAPFALMVIQGIAGVAALIIMVLFILLAGVSWFQPQLRVVTGLIIVVLALASILLTNLGGFLVGMLLGVHSGASIAAWKPREGELPQRGPRQPRQRRPRPWMIDAAPPVVSGAPNTLDTTPIDSPHPDHTDAPHPDDIDSPPPDHTDAPHPDDAGTASLPLRRPRRPTRGAQGLGIGLTLLALVLAPTPRAAAASTAPPATALRADLFCDIFPWLCPAPAPSPGPTPAPSPSPSDDVPLPSIPGVTGPDTPAAPVQPSTCDKALMPARAAVGTDLAKRAASIMQACVDQQKAGTLKVSTRAAGGGPTIVSTVPARVTATKQTMTGLSYDGVVTVQTNAGPKRALKFSADTVTIEGFRQEVTQPGVKATLYGPRNVVLSGNVSLYVFSQSGKAFGLLPLTLDPDNPPPLVISFMAFTDVDSRIAYQDADTLSFPSGNIKVG